MSFDEEPDGDIHGECAAEISRLQAELAAIRSAEMPEEPEDFVIYRPFDDATYVPESYAKALRAFALRKSAEAEKMRELMTQARDWMTSNERHAATCPTNIMGAWGSCRCGFVGIVGKLHAAIDKERKT